MSYFSRFPNLLYMDESERLEVVTDVLRRVAFRTEYKDLTQLFTTFDVEDGERPEQFAFSFYGDPQLHWVILIINNIVDPYREWPLSEEQVLALTKKKYGEENIYNLHHLEVGGIIVDAATPIRYKFSTNIGGVSTADGTFIYNNQNPENVSEILFSLEDQEEIYRKTFFQQIDGIDAPSKGLLIVSTEDKPAINVFNVLDVVITEDLNRTDARLFVEPINAKQLPITTVGGIQVNNSFINFTSPKVNGKLTGRFTTLPIEPINNLEYETRINESKRSMRVLSPDLLEEFIKQFEEVLNK